VGRAIPRPNDDALRFPEITSATFPSGRLAGSAAWARRRASGSAGQAGLLARASPEVERPSHPRSEDSDLFLLASSALTVAGQRRIRTGFPFPAPGPQRLGNGDLTAMWTNALGGAGAGCQAAPHLLRRIDPNMPRRI